MASGKKRAIIHMDVAVGSTTPKRKAPASTASSPNPPKRKTPATTSKTLDVRCSGFVSTNKGKAQCSKKSMCYNVDGLPRCEIHRSTKYCDALGVNGCKKKARGEENPKYSTLCMKHAAEKAEKAKVAAEKAKPAKHVAEVPLQIAEANSVETNKIFEEVQACLNNFIDKRKKHQCDSDSCKVNLKKKKSDHENLKTILDKTKENEKELQSKVTAAQEEYAKVVAETETETEDEKTSELGGKAFKLMNALNILTLQRVQQAANLKKSRRCMERYKSQLKNIENSQVDLNKSRSDYQKALALAIKRSNEILEG